MFREGVVGATNPKFTGTIIVTGASIGGTSGELSTNSIVCPIKGDITKAIA